MAKPDGSTTLLGFVWDEFSSGTCAIIPEYYAVVASEDDGKPVKHPPSLDGSHWVLLTPTHVALLMASAPPSLTCLGVGARVTISFH